MPKKVKDLFDHLRNDHSVYEKYNRYACMQGQCCRSFANRYTYAKHIEMCHHDDLNDNIYGSENEANACTNYTSYVQKIIFTSEICKICK